MSLAVIESFGVPERVIRATDEALRDAGRGGYERFVLWTGIAEGKTFTVRTCHVPRQTGYRLRSGVCVRVEGEELHRLNRWLFEHGETLAVQIHSHPTHAYHSDTDDAYPIVTQLGALSIVVPDFGARGLAGVGVAVYRLGQRGWSRVPSAKATRLLRYGM